MEFLFTFPSVGSLFFSVLVFYISYINQNRCLTSNQLLLGKHFCSIFLF